MNETSEYNVKDGLITSPGKYERQPIYTPHFDRIWLDGGEDDIILIDGRPAAVVVVTDKDREKFPELNDAYAILVSEDESGFVSSQVIDEDEAEDLLG